MLPVENPDRDKDGGEEDKDLENDLHFACEDDEKDADVPGCRKTNKLD